MTSITVTYLSYEALLFYPPPLIDKSVCPSTVSFSGSDIVEGARRYLTRSLHMRFAYVALPVMVKPIIGI